jgi:Bacterial Ig-like domain (group 1)
VLDQFSRPLIGADVSFNVTGKNPGTGASTTNSAGLAGFCYSGSVTGADTITASQGTATDTAAKTWITPPPVATRLVLTPKVATNPLGTQHCVTATVTDQFNLPFLGANVAFTVTGSNPTSGSSTTTSSGQAAFCWVGTLVGVDAITATSGALTDSASKTWEDTAPVAAKIRLTPKKATNPLGTQHCVIATVTDQPGRAVAGQRVDFRVTGSNPTTGSSITNAAGEAMFCYVGMTAGADTIVASRGTLSASATKFWEAPPPKCVRDADYWLDHPGDWPVSSLTLGSVTYAKADLLKILEASVRSDTWTKNALMFLAGDLIAARLNQASGAAVPPAVAAAMASADALIGRTRLLPIGKCSVSAGAISSLQYLLDAYNNGAIKGGPPSCHDCSGKSDEDEDDGDGHGPRGGDKGADDHGKGGQDRRGDRDEDRGKPKGGHRDGDGCLPGHHGHTAGDRCQGRDSHHEGDGCKVRSGGHAQAMKRGRR